MSDGSRKKHAVIKEKIFSPDRVNSGRQKELDIAKAVLIFCLALVHCTIECTPEEQLVSGIPYLFDSVIGGPLGAPMFMFAMGVGVAYTRHATPKELAVRGIGLGIVGYVLNLCRFAIPFLSGYLLTGDYEKFIAPLPYRVLGNDILQFACLTLLMVALFLRLGMTDFGMLVVSLFLSFVGMCVNGMDVGNPAGNIFLGYLVGTEDAAGMVFSDFPLCNWLIVPVCGYIFGKKLLYVKNKRLFYRVISPVCLLVCAVYFSIGIFNEIGMFGEGQNCYYHITTPDVLVSILAAAGLLGVYYVIAERLPAKWMEVLTHISKYINSVYCIHWVLVIWITNVLLYTIRGTQVLPIGRTLLLGAAISVVSIGIAHVWSVKGKAAWYGH